MSAYQPWSCPMVAGVDEVGRGPLAGPVVAAAVMMADNPSWHELTDSKKLTPAKRQHLDGEIRRHALGLAIGQASAREVDHYNILQATMLAMQRAVAGLALRPAAVWVDGNRAPPLPVPVRTLVKGDSRIPAISAASVIAKIHRDQYMISLDDHYPGYGMASHKGYGTAEHRMALQHWGPIPEHRRSFAPVAAAVADHGHGRAPQ